MMMQKSFMWCVLLCLSMAVAAVKPTWQNTAKANPLIEQSLAKQAASDRGFYPHYLGPLVDVQNAGVKGQVYIVNSTTIKIEGLTLPVGPPAPLFWIDYHHLLSGQGVHLPSEKYGEQEVIISGNGHATKLIATILGVRYNILGTYSNEDVFVTIPPSSQFPDVISYKSFGVWCAKFFVNFAYIAWR